MVTDNTPNTLPMNDGEGYSEEFLDGYLNGFELGFSWAVDEAEAVEFDMLAQDDLTALHLTRANSPTLLGHLTGWDDYHLDFTTPFGRGIRDAALSVYAGATGADTEPQVVLTLVQREAVLSRIEVSRLLAEETAYERGLDVGADWAANADPDDIDALHDVDQSIQCWQDFSDLGLDRLAEWMTNDLENGWVRYLDFNDPYHRGVIAGALNSSAPRTSH